MYLSIIVIGDEILLGQVTDTNSGAVARTFCPAGWTVRRIITIGDNRDEITRAIIASLADCQLVITTGGLGPTKDDITKAVMTEIFGGQLVHDPSVTENIHEIFHRRGLPMNRLTEGQAMVPSSCTVIQNRFGTAPLMWFDNDGKVLVAMPGVPFETEGMLPEVAARVASRFTPDENSFHHTVVAAGLSESALAEHLDAFETALPPALHLAYLPMPGYIRLRLDGRGNIGREEFDAALARLVDLLGSHFVCDGDLTPEAVVIDLLRERSLTLATAESCTGGNIARRITSVAGASDVFPGGIVSYANSVKAGALGVDPETIAAYGAVSEEVVVQMALGACEATGARCSVATSGIAGPGGGSPEKPVGTVWMAWALDGRVEARRMRFPGDRARVIDRASTEALLGVASMLRGLPSTAD